MCHCLVLSEAVTYIAIVGNEYLERSFGAYVDNAVHGNNVVIMINLFVWLYGH